eukprot:2768010-Prymnesium_polylepis.1
MSASGTSAVRRGAAAVGSSSSPRLATMAALGRSSGSSRWSAAASARCVLRSAERVALVSNAIGVPPTAARRRAGQHSAQLGRFGSRRAYSAQAPPRSAATSSAKLSAISSTSTSALAACAASASRLMARGCSASAVSSSGIGIRSTVSPAATSHLHARPRPVPSNWRRCTALC